LEDHGNVKIINGIFEEFHETDFDLVIGNPPYGRMRAKTKVDPVN
jgi:methylase of polypeptide subunit release factors